MQTTVVLSLLCLLVATALAGTACQNSDCDASNICQQGVCCEGKCIDNYPQLKIGSDCNSTKPCEGVCSAGICSQFGDQCVRDNDDRRGQGCSCTTGSKSKCDSNICYAFKCRWEKLPNGAPCEEPNGEECFSGLCAEDPANPLVQCPNGATCQCVGQPNNAQCTTTADAECGTDLQCLFISQCIPPPPGPPPAPAPTPGFCCQNAIPPKDNGQPCFFDSECTSGVCNTKTALCVAETSVADNEPCAPASASSRVCASLWCANETCQATGTVHATPDGQPCDSALFQDAQCSLDSICQAGVCTRKKGEACNIDGDCGTVMTCQCNGGTSTCQDPGAVPCQTEYDALVAAATPYVGKDYAISHYASQLGFGMPWGEVAADLQTAGAAYHCCKTCSPEERAKIVDSDVGQSFQRYTLDCKANTWTAISSPQCDLTSAVPESDIIVKCPDQPGGSGATTNAASNVLLLALLGIATLAVAVFRA